LILPEQYFTRSEAALAAARVLRDAGFTFEAVSRGYYAAFYTASALLASNGISLTKHSAVVARYGLLYARTAVLDPRYHWLLISAGRLRIRADYGPWDGSVKPRDAEWVISEATEFLVAVREFMRSQG